MCEARQQRGLMIAAKCRIKQNGNDAWLVPSQSTPGGKYSVYRDVEGFRCTCPDHEIGGCQCKHIYAVKIVIEREENKKGDAARIENESQPRGQFLRCNYCTHVI